VRRLPGSEVGRRRNHRDSEDLDMLRRVALTIQRPKLKLSRSTVGQKPISSGGDLGTPGYRPLRGRCRHLAALQHGSPRRQVIGELKVGERADGFEPSTPRV
jgi:hypothetical protein